MKYSLKDVKSAIATWDTFRSSSLEVLELIAGGNYFHITRNMYDIWKTKNPEYIHAYLGVIVDPVQKIEFFLIDSESDKDPEFTIDDIFSASYNYGFERIQVIPSFAANGVPNMNVSVLAGLERSFRWMLNRKNWIEDNVAPPGSESGGIFQAIHIPMSDLVSVFETTSSNNSVVVFGLKSDNTAELLVWSEDFEVQEDVEDVALPIPPFHNIENYQLLKHALNL